MIHKNDIGTEIILDTTVDITSATVLEIHYKKPDKTFGVWEAYKVTDTKLGYTTSENDLDEVGSWVLQAYIETPVWKGHGGVIQINVKEINQA